ncbi:MAG: GerW family sporulation protein [Oscillospiraceae bacterium]
MGENKVNNLLGVTIDKIKEMIDVDTVIGSQITTEDGTVIIPISRINYGFASGGSDLPSKSNPAAGLFGGGAGAGVTVTPIAFLILKDGNVKVTQIEPFTSAVDRVVQNMPDIVEKITAAFGKKSGEKPIS